MELRGRSLARNAGKSAAECSAAECSERLSRCISDDDWECSSEEDAVSEEEKGSEACNEEKSASTRSSVKRVASVVAKFDDKKRELVRSIGFGGILDLGQINKVSRKFTVWLLSKLDPENRTIDVNGEPQVEMVDFDVKRILGIPCGSRKVTPLRHDDVKTKRNFMQQMIGSLPDESNSLLAAGRVVTKEYPLRMTKKQCDNFKVSFVVYVIGHFLAPTTKNNVGNSAFWGALTNPDEIGQYNWSEYVLDNIVEAAVKVQADIRRKKKIANITGCSILLQILYLETLKIDGITKPKDVYPRIKAYTCSYLRKLIEADKASSSSSARNPTWGSTIGRRLPPVVNSTCIDEAMMLKKLRGASEFREELAEFGRENFSGKLNESHVNAMIAYGERCNTHFNTLRTSLMKENLFLVEMLMQGSFVAAKEKNVPTSGCVQVPGKDNMKHLRGYESASEGSRCGTRKINHIGTETLLTGVSIGSNYVREGAMSVPCQEVQKTAEVELVAHGHSSIEGEGKTASGASVQVGKAEGNVDPPSFDLGIDLETPEKCIKDNAVQKSDWKPTTTTVNLELAVQTAPSADFAIFGRTPGSGKRKSEEVNWITPEQKLKPSTTSPASMSKILADGVVFARMVRSEDELDINMKPWDHETTDSPVNKQAIVPCRIAKSPWFYGLSHRNCPQDAAQVIFEQLMTIGQEELERSWIIHRNPRYLSVSGTCIKKSFSLEEPFDYDLYDLALRRIVQLDGTMYKDSTEKCWRHILESDFAVLAQADENPSFHKSIREQFFGTGVKHNISRCRMLVVPAQVLRNWCCYFWDFKKKYIHIFDPLYKQDQSAYYQSLHGPIVSKIGAEIANCIDSFFENWKNDWNQWEKVYVPSTIVPENSNESALLSLMSISKFDGEGFKEMTQESYKVYKMVLLADLLSMVDNQANPPLKHTVKNVPMPMVLDIDDE